MADAGAIGKFFIPRHARAGIDVWINNGYAITSKVNAEPFLDCAMKSNWYRTLANASGVFVPVKENGSLSGTVTENAVAVAECRVYLYWRPSGQCVGFTRTDASGAFSFTGLDPDETNYFVVALDPDGGTTYNAIVFDRLTPV